MKIKNIDTGETVDLDIIDSRTGTDWIQDFIGNESGFGSVWDGLIDYVKDNNEYIATSLTIDWWVNIINRQKIINSKLLLIRKDHGDDTVDKIVSSIDGDLECRIDELEFALKQMEKGQI